MISAHVSVYDRLDSADQWKWKARWNVTIAMRNETKRKQTGTRATIKKIAAPPTQKNLRVASEAQDSEVSRSQNNSSSMSVDKEKLLRNTSVTSTLSFAQQPLIWSEWPGCWSTKLRNESEYSGRHSARKQERKQNKTQQAHYTVEVEYMYRTLEHKTWRNWHRKERNAEALMWNVISCVSSNRGRLHFGIRIGFNISWTSNVRTYFELARASNSIAKCMTCLISDERQECSHEQTKAET